MELKKQCKERFQPAVDAIEELLKQQMNSDDAILIAIDGRCGSGKTTLGNYLNGIFDSNLFHMDDFFLPPALRTPERRSEPGGNVHYERFLTEVLPNLRSGRPFSYRRFDCSRMTLGEEIPVENNGYVFVEGAYSCHPVFGDYMDRRVFLDIDGKTQEERIRKRNGEDRLQDFLQLWIPLEEAYFQTFSVWEKADYIIL